MRCDVGSCWNRGRINVQVFIRSDEDSGLVPVRFAVEKDDDLEMRAGRIFGLCYGCYLRLVRQRRRSGDTHPWPDGPLEWDQFWSAFEGWEPEPENPSDSYLAEMETTVWRGR